MTRRARSVFLGSLGVALGLALFQGCSSSGGDAPGDDLDAGPEAAVCPSIVQADTCPTPTPSFQTDIEPLIMQYCYACHGPGGVEQSAYDFTTYKGIHAARTTMGFELQNCLMPLPDAGSQPSAAERETIINWALTCDAPNN